MKKPTLRGVLLGSLLAVGLVLVLVGGAIGHVGYQRMLERMESGRAKSLAAAAVYIGESASDETERVRLFRALASDGDAVGIALLGGDPVRVLAGTQAAWAGQEALALAELDATGRLHEWLLAPREGPIRDRSFDPMSTVTLREAQDTGFWGRRPVSPWFSSTRACFSESSGRARPAGASLRWGCWLRSRWSRSVWSSGIRSTR